MVDGGSYREWESGRVRVGAKSTGNFSTSIFINFDFNFNFNCGRNSLVYS